MLIFGSAPGYGILLDTQLIKDVMRCFMQLYNKENLSIMFPDVLSHLRGSDAKIELVTTTMLQKLRIVINHFKIVRSSAFIFV